MRNFIKNFAQDESGATAIEYGLIAALMAVVIIAGIGAFGTALENKFKAIGTIITTGKAPAA
ncbi:Flp family type IVb pilin [Brevundimonas bullata]|uniref:Flp family type IVb pilin n=1 Tax=Brevundimonas bullata TaxID=13160 RepID=UPI000E0CB8E5|nr:Flp family type IVb pilin [Brevundimonas bullata]WQE36451.1 Flp family type IVb pilin [Brevundimonas bullata]